MSVQYRVGKQQSNSRKDLMVHETETLSLEAQFVCDMIRQLGIVACKSGGEDTSGRQKLALLTPTEVVDRALAISQYAFEKFRENGLVTNLPDINEIWPDLDKDDE